MSKTMIRLTTTLLAIAVIFTLAGIAEAGQPASRTAPAFHRLEMSETGSLLGQAWAWLTSLWTETTQIVTKNAPLPPGNTDTTTSSTSCTNPQGCEAGYGLDPNG